MERAQSYEDVHRPRGANDRDLADLIVALTQSPNWPPRRGTSSSWEHAVRSLLLPVRAATRRDRATSTRQGVAVTGQPWHHARSHRGSEARFTGALDCLDTSSERCLCRHAGDGGGALRCGLAIGAAAPGPVAARDRHDRAGACGGRAPVRDPVVARDPTRERTPPRSASAIADCFPNDLA